MTNQKTFTLSEPPSVYAERLSRSIWYMLNDAARKTVEAYIDEDDDEVCNKAKFVLELLYNDFRNVRTLEELGMVSIISEEEYYSRIDVEYQSVYKKYSDPSTIKAVVKR